ncbi:Hypothetical predicted protein [Pelobates cultripes]|uniref:Uncharacterized protein n=1 Tax=Pelobates cultripes TaxID=61616 RepID=A0AAD1TEP7_PELCU|nr:Hypothetical predicted protein [Pelobates cultripes]
MKTSGKKQTRNNSAVASIFSQAGKSSERILVEDPEEEASDASLSCSDDTAHILHQMRVDKSYPAEAIALGTQALKADIQAIGVRTAELEALVEQAVQALNNVDDT